MIGGIQSFFNLLPFIVDIFILSKKINGSHTCAGSLVSYDWVLTAAHCTRVKPITSYYLGAGRDENTYFVTTQGYLKFNYGQTRKIKQIIRHEKFDYKTLSNDIALIKTKVPFKDDKFLSPIKLPVEDEKVDLTKLFKYCYTGGWGVVGPNNMVTYNQHTKNWTHNQDYKNTSKLVYLVLPLISNKQCQRIYSYEMRLIFDVDDTQLCTLYYPGRKSLCRGDSGSPLICGSKQYGVASWSFGCGTPRMGADAFIRVDKYVEWINKTTNIFASNKRSNTIINFSPDEYDYYDLLTTNTAASNMTKLIFMHIVCLGPALLLVMQ